MNYATERTRVVPRFPVILEDLRSTKVSDDEWVIINAVYRFFLVFLSEKILTELRKKKSESINRARDIPRVVLRKKVEREAFYTVSSRARALVYFI